MIKLSYNIQNFRKQILETISEEDVIIELGSHIGGTSKLILDNLNNCEFIAIDNSPEAIDKMSQLDLKFISGDVRKHDTIVEVFKIVQKCDILLIDLGGGYHPDTVFKVFYIWASTFKPKFTFIRNRGLLEFSNSVFFDEFDYKSEKGYIESYHSEGVPPQIKEFELCTDSL